MATSARTTKIAIFYNSETAEVIREKVTGTPDEMAVWLTEFCQGRQLILLGAVDEDQVDEALGLLQPHVKAQAKRDRAARKKR